MKPTLFIFIALISIHVQAQTRHSFRTVTDPHTKANIFLKHLLRQQYEANTPAARSTSVIKERLIGQANYGGAPMPDSLAMVYSGQHGSTFDLQFMTYSEVIGPDFMSLGNNYPFGVESTTGILYPHNEAPGVQSDTTWQWSNFPPPLYYGPFATETHTYDANNNMLDDVFMGDTGGIWQRDMCTYNGASNITSIRELSGNSITGRLPWDSSYLAVLTYNTSGQLVVDSQCIYDAGTLSWIPDSKFTYAYDAAGNLLSVQSYSWGASWVLSGSYTMTYYAGTHNLQTFENDSYSPAVTPQIIDSFGYTPGVNYWTWLRFTGYSGGSLFDVYTATKNVNSHSLPDTIQSYDYGTTSTVQSRILGVLVYDTYNNPLTLVSYQDTGSAMPTTVSGKSNYYYETYTASSVPQIVAENNIKIYPNPAADVVNITWPGFIINAPVSITVYNISGQKLISENLQWQDEAQQVSVAGLMPGAYIVSIANKDGVLHTAQVVKL